MAHPEHSLPPGRRATRQVSGRTALAVCLLIVLMALALAGWLGRRYASARLPASAGPPAEHRR